MRYPYGVWSGYYNVLRPDQAMDRFISAGFTHMEWATEHTLMLLEEGSPETMGRQAAAWAKERNFFVPQGHISFKGGTCDDARFEQIKKEVDFFLSAGIPNAVIHANGGDDLPFEERYARWVHYFTALCEYVKGTDLTFCLENLGSVPFTHRAENILKLIDDCGGKNLGICLDTGHLHLTRIRDGNTQTTTEFVRTAGDRLKALHIHENNGMADDHQMPFSAKKAYDWRELIRALDEVGYQGLFDMEIVGESIRHPLAVRDEKLKYVRFLCEYMLSDEFLNEE